MKNDFPAWFSPAVVKELRQGLKSRAFITTLAALPALLAILFMMGFIVNEDSNTFIRSDTLNVFFWITLCISLLAVIPLRGLSTVHTELRSKTADMLVLTRLTPWKVVWGKWCSLMVQTLLILFALLPFALVRYYYGSVNLVEDIIFIVFLFVASGTLTAISIWMSGNHGAARSLFTIALIFSGITSMAYITQRSYHDDYSDLVFVVFYLVLIGLSFLILASKWFTLESDNIWAKFRLLLLLAIIPLPFIHEYGNDMEMLTIPAMVWLLFAFIYSFISPQELRPVHLQRKKGIVKGFYRIFLVPGTFSAIAFSLLFLLLVYAVCVVSAIMDGSFSNSRVFIEVPMVFCMLWSGLVIITGLTGIFKKKAGGAAIFVYLLLAASMFLLTSIFKFMGMEGLAVLIPLGNLSLGSSAWQIDGDFSKARIAVIVVHLMIALAITAKAGKPWLKLVRQKPDKKTATEQLTENG